MIRILHGDCTEMLATLPANSVHCVVTSPPYYGLRDYGTAQWDGGDAGCDHTVARTSERDRVQHETWAPPSGWTNRDATPPRQCKCGATRIDRQIGLEATPDEYLATMVAVFREVRRVLRNDGTCWLNIGDSYASTGGATSGGSDFSQWKGGQTLNDRDKSNKRQTGLKPKDLLMMPARLARALQADGWWIRSDIIWHKPNPMPESCTDRPTSSHEHVFLLTKSGATTFWTHRDHAGSRTSPPPDYRWVHVDTKYEVDVMPAYWDTEEHVRKLWRRINLWRGHDYFYDADAIKEPSVYPEDNRKARSAADQKRYPDAMIAGVREGSATYPTRSCRNVWTIATAPYSYAHFATFPPALAERCIRAGTSERGCCAACGAPWVRQIETHYTDGGPKHTGNATSLRYIKDGERTSMPYKTRHDTTAGWSPSCACAASDPTSPWKLSPGSSSVPCTVLDPFAGAFTAPMVADRLQRHAIGIELNPEYCEMARARVRKDAGMFAEIVA